MTNKTKYGFDEKVLESILTIGRRHNLDKIVLFGSRSRGDFGERSDIDLAVYGGNADIFALDVDDEVPTLLKFDVVNMNQEVQPELVDSVNREGVTIYEKI